MGDKPTTLAPGYWHNAFYVICGYCLQEFNTKAITVMHAMHAAKEHGWNLLDGKWYCHPCTKKLVGEVEEILTHG
jgi:hypothetical protein